MTVIIIISTIVMVLSTVSSVDLLTNQRTAEMFIATTTATTATGKSLMLQNMGDTLPQCGSEEMHEIGIFSLYDYSILIGMLVISLGIGKILLNDLFFKVIEQW